MYDKVNNCIRGPDIEHTCGDAQGRLDPYLLLQTAVEVHLHVADCHPVLGPLGAAHVGDKGAQLDLYHL